MLTKLLKYDLKTIYKGLTIFYVLAIISAILTRCLFLIENSFIMDIIAKIFSGITISMIFNILINNMMRTWGKFRENLYGDESYLTHTLPVEKKTLYLSKFLTTLITLFTSTLVITLTLFIAYYSKENIEFIKNLLLPLADIYNGTVLGIILVFIFICYLEIVNMVQSGFLGTIIGHRKNNHKIISSIIYGILVYFGTQTLVILSVFITGLFNKDIMNLFNTVEVVNLPILKTAIYIAIIAYTLNIIILNIISSIVFKKGVNVD